MIPPSAPAKALPKPANVAPAANTTVIEKAISYKVMNREPAGANNVLKNDT